MNWSRQARAARGRWSRLTAGAGGGSLVLSLVLSAAGAAGCGSSSSGTTGSDVNGDDDSCTPGDNDGISGGAYTVLVNVSDTAYAVGGVDSGSTSPNIAVQNFGNVTLTLTNVGTRPHDLVVQCIPSGLPATCSMQTSCFPGMAASIPGYIAIVPSVDPGMSATVTFMSPAVEGAYQFVSDDPGDTGADGGVSGPIGEFVLM
jgi:hypothetical protein